MRNELILEHIHNLSQGADSIEGELGKFISNKKEWKPFPINPKDPDPFTEITGTHECIRKCISLAIALELPVGLFAIEGASSNEVNGAGLDSMAYALEDNARDEENHYEAFQLASVAYDVPLEYLDKVEEFRNKALELEEHPVLLAGFLELTVFFPSLAMLRKWGNPSLKNMTAYVSRDEACHVNVNFHIIDQLGLKWNDFQSVNDLRKEIIEWVTSDLKGIKEDSAHWEKVSTNLMETRQAPDLEWTKAAVMPAFFELAAY